MTGQGDLTAALHTVFARVDYLVDHRGLDRGLARMLVQAGDLKILAAFEVATDEQLAEVSTTYRQHRAAIQALRWAAS